MAIYTQYIWLLKRVRLIVFDYLSGFLLKSSHTISHVPARWHLLCPDHPLSASWTVGGASRWLGHSRASVCDDTIYVKLKPQGLRVYINFVAHV